MKVTMNVQISGAVNGVEYPAPGQVLDTTDEHGAELCARGQATPVVDDKEERATVSTGEKRAAAKKA